MRIRREKTLGVVVDVQSRLLPHIHENQRIVKNMVKLIKGLKILDIPLVVTQQYTKGLGLTVPQIEEALQDYDPIEKLAFSCCGSPDFMEKITESGKNNVILMGIEAHVCVLQTAIDLAALNYQPVIIADCVSSRKPEDKAIALDRMKTEGAILSTSESILFELCEIAGTPAFKEISKLVK